MQITWIYALTISGPKQNISLLVAKKRFPNFFLRSSTTQAQGLLGL